jgi:chitinase
MNDAGQPTAATFSNLAASSSAQNAFFRSLLSFMTTYSFDGVDIDWEYPVAPERSGIPADYQNYPTFLGTLKQHLGQTDTTMDSRLLFRPVIGICKKI